ncbi:TPA: LOW QUALITY PROTEIN: hypothetical protein N0F65_012999 [Lagenidium giganteum]|uniref:Uncharacterized protein n=1 Tax=Lagenidium giganteum TaxID=4803 RepID=A0AAV2YGB9_9STRA|nr:TPA: LOW QUALITY PROTEIN: hypothetical protein N0F65_012999 [Lagenidium giganteum]
MRKLNVANRSRHSTSNGAGGARGGDDDSSSTTSPPSAKKVVMSLDGEEDSVEEGNESPTDTSSHNAALHYGSGGAGYPASVPMTQQVNTSNSNSTNGNTTNHTRTWRDQVASSVREGLRGKIAALLRSMKPNAPAKVLEKLPGMAHRMEESLLQFAPNEHEYMDQTTLRHRLSLIQQQNAVRLLQQQHKPPSISPKQHHQSATNLLSGRTPLTEEQAKLMFQCLQGWRLKLVNTLGVTPSDIVPNQLLARVAVVAPKSPQELATCGLSEHQLERFGPSLLQEVQTVLASPAFAQGGSTTVIAPPAVQPTPAEKALAKHIRKATESTSRRSIDTSASKKRKTGSSTADSAAVPVATSQQPRLAPAGAAFLQPAPGMFLRPAPVDTASATVAVQLGQQHGLPTLLPTPTTSGNKKSTPPSLPPGSGAAGVRVQAATPVLQQPFFSRLQPMGTENEQDNHMHLLAQSAGQLSKQQQQQQQQQQQSTPAQPEGKSIETYEKEVQALRWLLQQAQHEKSQLELESAMATATPMGVALVEGQTLLGNGRYRFLHRVGTGTFAVVVRALEVATQRAVAIKRMHQPELNVLGEREAQILTQVNAHDPDGHCAIVQLLDHFYECDHLCLVMELLGDPLLPTRVWAPMPVHCVAARHKLFTALVGTTLPAVQRPVLHAKTHASKQSMSVTATPWSVPALRQLAVQLCGALAVIHERGFLHADLKPDNILHVPGGAVDATQRFKIADFGNCIDQRQIPLYEEDFEIQTPAYRAPEVATGLEITAAIDMWSLGCILLECATGEPFIVLSDHVVLEDAQCDLTAQIEALVTQQQPLHHVHKAYRRAKLYGRCLHTCHTPPATATMQTKLTRFADHPEFCAFVMALLDVHPRRRLTARMALFHPFVQSFFPFRMLFEAPLHAPIEEEDATSDSIMSDGRGSASASSTESDGPPPPSGQQMRAPSRPSTKRRVRNAKTKKVQVRKQQHKVAPRLRDALELIASGAASR